MDSEYRIYDYIKRCLHDAGWNTHNPARGGDVYTQSEFYKHDTLLREGLGRKAPENIVRIPFEKQYYYWVIEAKPSHTNLDKALTEAKAYAEKINTVNSTVGPLARFITAVAGSPEDTFWISTCYWNGEKWSEVSINNYETTGFLNLQQCCDILHDNTPNIEGFDADSERFLKKANSINKTLHDNAFPIGDRAQVMGALLLALVEEPYMHIYPGPKKMISAINANIETVLEKHGKEGFLATISLRLPATPKNHKKYRQGIIETLQILREMNVRSAINSGDDALGSFYETFLKYSRGAKDMGIVLTPRHITQLGVELIDVKSTDAIFDPTCGTGGFLVAAMDYVRKNETKSDKYEKFKRNGLWGVESDDPVYGLALVNMIFRGDGKSGLQDGDCFDHEFWGQKGDIFYTLPNERTPESEKKAFDKVLMNPPFAAKAEPREFVDYALSQMKPGGILFAVLPNAPICGGKGDLIWRKQLVKRHTVKACIKFPGTLFYPNASKGTYGLILEAWNPHKANAPVFFASLFDDEHAHNLSKTKSTWAIEDNMEVIKESISKFFDGKDVETIPREIFVDTLNLDNGYDFSPEAYLTERLESGIGVAKTSHNLEDAIQIMTRRKNPPKVVPSKNTKPFSIIDILEIKKGTCASLKHLKLGDTPVITTKESDNGIAGFFCVPPDRIFRDAITISANGGGGQAFWHPYDFAATGDVMIGKLKSPFPDTVEFKLFLCEAITNGAWRFDYYRKCSYVRLKENIEIRLPMKNGQIDEDMIASEVSKTAGIDMLKDMIDD